MTLPQAFGYLQGISSNMHGKRYNLSSEVVLIGRGSACQIQLKDPKVSRQHARVRGGLAKDISTKLIPLLKANPNVNPAQITYWQGIQRLLG